MFNQLLWLGLVWNLKTPTCKKNMPSHDRNVSLKAHRD